MIIGGAQFLSMVDIMRTVAITGPKGSGKDLLAHELSEYYLKRGYKFNSNQASVWNDPLYNEVSVPPEEWERIKAGYGVSEKFGPYKWVNVDKSFNRLFDPSIRDEIVPVPLKPEDVQSFFKVFSIDADGNVVRRSSNVRKMVLVLSEGGRYLRAWKYFEDMYEFTRKTDNYIFIPSIRLPHDDLCEIICMNAVPFKNLIGINGGIWAWYVSGNGLAKPIKGWFIHFVGKVGLYDTYDVSTSPREIIFWFQRLLEEINESAGRDGLSAMASGSSIDEQDTVSKNARRIEQAAMALQASKNKR